MGYLTTYQLLDLHFSFYSLPWSWWTNRQTDTTEYSIRASAGGRRGGCSGDAENARPENNGQRKLWVWKMQEWKMTDKNYGVWKMQDWKMTDKLLENCEHNYGVWKMQDWKMTDKLLANCERNYVCIFDVYLANYRKTLLELD